MTARRKQPGIPPTGDANSRPVRADYVDRIRQQNQSVLAVDNVDAQQQAVIDTTMAQIRGATVRARRFAGHPDKLSQDMAVTKRTTFMTDTTTADRSQAQSQQRGSSGKPRVATNTASFNPLHPSMELPPEELIRLLGLETKKLRKQRNASASKKPETAARKPTVADHSKQNSVVEEPPANRKTAQPKADSPSKPVRKAQYSNRQRSTARRTRVKRRGLLLPAVSVGLISAIALSFYLFWSAPADDKPAAEAPPPVTGNKPVTTAKPRVAVKPETASKPAAVATTVKPVKTLPLSEDPDWSRAVNAETRRLRKSAEQRFKQRAAGMTSTADTAAVAAPPAEPSERLRPGGGGQSIDAAPLTSPTETPLEETVTEPAATSDTQSDTQYELVDDLLDADPQESVGDITAATHGSVGEPGSMTPGPQPATPTDTAEELF